MKILLIDIDSTIPNLALKKIEYYYKKRGAEIGGTGYDIKKKLPVEIERIKPKINIDFATRGCIRKCKFCFVPEKEGKIRVDRDLYDIWNGVSKVVVFLDNNILAMPDHFKLICKQAQKENVRIDFNQGLDIRLVTDEIGKILSKTNMKYYRFALDHPSFINIFNKKLEILKIYISLKQVLVYVLVGFNTKWDDDMKRLVFIKGKKCRPYLMRHENIYGNRKYNELAAWVNQRRFFITKTYDEFREIYKNRYKPVISKSQYSMFNN